MKEITLTYSEFEVFQILLFLLVFYLLMATVSHSFSFSAITLSAFILKAYVVRLVLGQGVQSMDSCLCLSLTQSLIGPGLCDPVCCLSGFQSRSRLKGLIVRTQNENQYNAE